MVQVPFCNPQMSRIDVDFFFLKNEEIEGEEKKSLQNILFYIAKVINPRVKSQARFQKNRSIDLK